jgi:hypothetical protein
MAQRLKRWESPRKEGRNDKGKGGSARQRQLKKRTQMLRQKLKDQGNDNNSQGQTKKGENHDSLPFLLLVQTPYSPLLAPRCLEKVLHLGKPQDRTFRSPLPKEIFSTA